MPTRVLIVDDSAFFRRRLTEIFKADPTFDVVGTAADGKEAIDAVVAHKPDVVTMDIEMPVLDGISAVRRIMAVRPTPILMFSSLTHEGAQATLDALEAGAMDFLPKRLEEIAEDFNEATRLLRARVRQLAQRGVRPAPARRAPPAPRPHPRPVPAAGGARRLQLVAIGASTGGPVALQQLLKPLPADFPLPLLIVQHMPATFTGAFAARLNQVCAIEVREAQDGDLLAPGTALLAPGGRQMVVETRNGQARVRVHDSAPEQHYRPCVDTTFASVARCLPGQALAVVLTGMGADGREGARALKQGGALVWAQDEKTCVVYGMPAAVAEAGLADEVLALPDIAEHLRQEVAAWTS